MRRNICRHQIEFSVCDMCTGYSGILMDPEGFDNFRETELHLKATISDSLYEIRRLKKIIEKRNNEIDGLYTRLRIFESEDLTCTKHRRFNKLAERLTKRGII